MHNIENIIPYVPIADRVQAINEKSQFLCHKLFSIIDSCVRAQLTFNHDTERGFLSIAPDQINDLLSELSKTEQLDKRIDINDLKQSLNDLIYPKFKGEHTVQSPIWNNESVRVWQFQLNQIATEGNMEISHNDVELLLDSTLSTLRVWRQSLEATIDNPQVTYSANDLVYTLMDIEQKIQKVQQQIEE